MCVLLGFLQKTWAIPIMNPLSWFMMNNNNNNNNVIQPSTKNNTKYG